MSKELVIECPELCSLHPDKIGVGAARALAAVRANGAGVNIFARRAEELLGHPVPKSNISRHFAHYREPETGSAPVIDPSKRLTDLEILDTVIQRGAQNSQNWKPTIKDTIEAMKLKMQMTGNSAFDDLMSLFDSVEASEVLGEDEDLAPESDEALLSPEERPDEADQDLEEPLL